MVLHSVPWINVQLGIHLIIKIDCDVGLIVRACLENMSRKPGRAACTHSEYISQELLVVITRVEFKMSPGVFRNVNNIWHIIQNRIIHYILFIFRKTSCDIFQNVFKEITRAPRGKWSGGHESVRGVRDGYRLGDRREKVQTERLNVSRHGNDHGPVGSRRSSSRRHLKVQCYWAEADVNHSAHVLLLWFHLWDLVHTLEM